MSTVDTKTIFENLSNINELCGSLKSICEGASSEVSKIAEAAQALKNYDGQLSKRFETIINDDTKQISEFRWNVTVPDNYININSNFNTSDVTTAIDNLINELNTNESIVEFIEQEINNLIAELSVNEDLKDAYNNSFESLRKNISLDGYSAINNKFVKISDDYVQYWTDEPLRFEYNPQTGAYLIFQGSVAMGYTNREGLMSYYNALTKVNEEKESKEEVVESVPLTEEGEEIVDEEKDEVVEEVPLTEDGDEIIQPEEYNDTVDEGSVVGTISSTASDVANDTLPTTANNQNLKTLINEKKDIYVPKDLSLYKSNGEKFVIDNGIFKYTVNDVGNEEYTCSMNDKGGVIGFSIEDMENAILIEK